MTDDDDECPRHDGGEDPDAARNRWRQIRASRRVVGTARGHAQGRGRLPRSLVEANRPTDVSLHVRPLLTRVPQTEPPRSKRGGGLQRASSGHEPVIPGDWWIELVRDERLADDGENESFA